MRHAPSLDKMTELVFVSEPCTEPQVVSAAFFEVLDVTPNKKGMPIWA
jgi:hypothetical protein